MSARARMYLERVALFVVLLAAGSLVVFTVWRSSIGGRDGATDELTRAAVPGDRI